MEDNKKNEPMSTEPLNDDALGDVAGGASLSIRMRDPNEPIDIMKDMTQRFQRGLMCPTRGCYGTLQGFDPETATNYGRCAESSLTCPSCGKKYRWIYNENGWIRYEPDY